MPTSNIFTKFNSLLTKKYKESFINSQNQSIAYIYIGNSLEYANTSNIPSSNNNIQYEKSIWYNMYAAKKISPSDVEIVIPRVNWTNNTVYKQYDDTVDDSLLITPDTLITTSIISLL